MLEQENSATGQRVDAGNFALYKSGERRAYVKAAGGQQFLPKGERFFRRP